MTHLPLSFTRNPLFIKVDTPLILGLDLSNDGSLLGVARVGLNGGATVLVYDTNSGAVRHELLRGFPQTNGVAFGGDGQSLYAIVKDVNSSYHLVRTDLDNQQDERLLTYSGGEHLHSINRDRNTAVIAVVGVSADVIETNAHQVVRSQEGDGLNPLVTVLHPDGRYLYSWRANASVIEVRDLDLDKPSFSLPAPGGSGKQLAVSPSGDYLSASALGSTGTFVYSLPDRARVLDDFLDETAPSTFNAFSHDGHVLAYCSIRLTGFRLPDVDVLLGPEVGVMGQDLSAASAYDAPVMAFAFESKLVCTRLVPEEAA